jgi:hypothetical protein
MHKSRFTVYFLFFFLILLFSPKAFSKEYIIDCDLASTLDNYDAPRIAFGKFKIKTPTFGIGKASVKLLDNSEGWYKFCDVEESTNTYVRCRHAGSVLTSPTFSYSERKLKTGHIDKKWKFEFINNENGYKYYEYCPILSE